MVSGCVYINLLFTAKSEKCIAGQGSIIIYKEKKKIKEFVIRKFVVL
jgi:hypothetical protein